MAEGEVFGLFRLNGVRKAITGRNILARRVYSRLRFARKYVRKAKIKQLMSYGSFAFISQISGQMIFNLDNLVIVFFLGLSHVTLYSIASRLVTYFRRFMGRSLGMMTTVFSQYEGRGDYESIREKFVFITKINGYTSMLIGGLLIIQVSIPQHLVIIPTPSTVKLNGVVVIRLKARSRWSEQIR